MPVDVVQEMPIPERSKMTRQRYLELVQVGREICDFLDGKDIKAGEHCIVRHATEEMLRLTKE